MFKSTQKLRPSATHHTRLEATVASEIGTPYFNALVTINGIAKTGTTDVNGNAIISEFEAGAYSVTVSGQGIITKTFGPFEFTRGQSLTENFICQPDFTNIPANTPQPVPSIN